MSWADAGGASLVDRSTWRAHHIAMDGATPFEFICAMWALGAPLSAAQVALGLTTGAFTEKYGKALAVFTERQRLGMAAQSAA